MKPKTGRKRGNGEGTMPVKLASGNYQAKIMLAGKRVYVTKPTAGEVTEAIKEIKKQHARGNDAAIHKYTVQTFLADWLKSVKANLAPSTHRGYMGHCKVHLLNEEYENSIADIPLEQLNGKHVQNLLDEIAENVPSPTTVKNINATLKTALTTAIKWQLIDRNAAKNARPPKQVEYETHPLERNEVIKLIEAAKNDRWEAILHLGCFEGMRRGEIAAIQWPNIDFQNMTITIKETLQRVEGEGLVLKGAKSKASKRTIPMLPIVAEALKRRRERQNMERVVAGESWKQDMQFVFTSRYGARVAPEDLYRMMKDSMLRAGFSQDRIAEVRLHDLRHSAAGLLLKLGIDLKTIQGILGHSSFQITAKFYLQAEKDLMRDAMDKLNTQLVSNMKPPNPVGVELVSKEKTATVN